MGKLLDRLMGRKADPRPPAQAYQVDGPSGRRKRPRRIRDTVTARVGVGTGNFELTPLTALGRVENPFAPAEPTGHSGATLAMDDDIRSFFNGMGSLNYQEGIGFLGYAYLSQLAQRPEYRKGAETLAREMTRKWIKLTSTGDDDKTDKLKLLEEEMKKLRVRDAFRRVAELDGFFGRGHIYLDTGATDDADELRTPLIADKRKIRKGSLKRVTVVEPLWTYPQTYNATDPLKRDFFSPQTWMVNSKEVHRSRLITFVGREVPDLLKPAYAFGGLSLSQMAKPYVDNWLRTRQSVSDLLHSFTVWGLKTDLAATFSGADDGDQLFKRADLFNKLRDNKGLMLLDKGSGGDDKGEEFFNVSVPLGTLDHLQAQSQEQMASVFSIPLVILLGITPSGLNASSDGEIRVFYDFIKAFQQHLFASPLEVILKVIQLSLFGEVDPEIGFEFIPLWELDEAAKAAVRKTEADTHAEYIAAGVVDAQEVREIVAEDKDGPYANIDPNVLPAQPLDPNMPPQVDADGNPIDPLAPPPGPEDDDETPPAPPVGAAPAKPAVAAQPAAPATPAAPVAKSGTAGAPASPKLLPNPAKAVKDTEGFK